MKQRRVTSLVESATNIVVGFALNTILNYYLLRLFGLFPSWGDSTGLALIFTAVSLVRTYGIRRGFEHLRVTGMMP